MNETEHLLTVLSEECAEVAQRACKAARFGLSEIQPGQSEDNKRRLERELADLMATADLLGLTVRDEDKAAKLEKLKTFMDYARQVGTLDNQNALVLQVRDLHNALAEMIPLAEGASGITAEVEVAIHKAKALIEKRVEPVPNDGVCLTCKAKIADTFDARKVAWCERCEERYCVTCYPLHDCLGR